MNPKIKKAKEELERTKAKIIELQALVPQQERNITDMENTEIVRLVRSANIPLDDLPEFIALIKTPAAPVPAETNTAERDNRDDGDGFNGDFINNEEDDADV